MAHIVHPRKRRGFAFPYSDNRRELHFSLLRREKSTSPFLYSLVLFLLAVYVPGSLCRYRQAEEWNCPGFGGMYSKAEVILCNNVVQTRQGRLPGGRHVGPLCALPVAWSPI